MSKRGSLDVVCRFRPPNKQELANGADIIVGFEDESEVKVNGPEFQCSFSFDRIFPPGTTQSEIYNYSIQTTLADVFNGYNGTVFAYGQSGAGKSFTMMGADIDNEQLRGIIPRISENIFRTIMESPPTVEYTVKVSYMEVYMERIRDLLAPQNDNLPIHEDKQRGVYVKGLMEVYVSSVNEVYEVLKKGSDARIVSATNMNAESSRSHSILLYTVTQKNLADGKTKMGRLFLVDLAGSEKVGKTGASGQTLEEAKKINKSLTSLGMVINALADGKSSHIPYRDSKLTRILQESLGGNSRTTLIINCSPCVFNEAETVSTLRFGMRAKTIKNKAKINQDLSPAELKALLKRAKSETVTYQQYIQLMEGELKIWRTGGSVLPENYATMDKVQGGNLIQAPPPPPAAAQSTSNAGETKANSTDSPPPSRMASPSPIPAHVSGRSRRDTSTSAAPSPSPLPGSVLGDASFRSDTPMPILMDDERDEFLKRENELNEQISEKEKELENLIQNAELYKAEIELLKDENKSFGAAHATMTRELAELRIQLSKLEYEYKDAQIIIDQEKESKSELEHEVRNLSDQITDLRKNIRINSNGEDGNSNMTREQRKAEKMQQMMDGLESSVQGYSLRSTIDALNGHQDEEAAVMSEVLGSMRKELSEKRLAIQQQEQVIRTLRREADINTKKRAEYESRISALEAEYEELLNDSIAAEEAEAANSGSDPQKVLVELKSRLEEKYNLLTAEKESESIELKNELELKNNEYNIVRNKVSDLESEVEELRTSLEAARTAVRLRTAGGTASTPAERDREMELLRRTLAQKLLEADTVRKSLMRDVQNRCEKIIELEMQLDEIRDEREQLLRKSNTAQQQQRMALLEKNVTQLTSIQKELVEQNASIKRELGISERKLAARNDRIQNLEEMNQQLQAQFTQDRSRYEQRISLLTEKLNQAQRGQLKQQSQQPSSMSFFSFGRVAKPIRGGGGANNETDASTAVRMLQGGNGSAADSTGTISGISSINGENPNDSSVVKSTFGGMLSPIGERPSSPPPQSNTTTGTPASTRRMTWLGWKS
ncbi:kinesin-domain-containing protein [Ramicandelaber brevisporus]|nr:kinesin-domain-containing protein [Ramicandelaber brevisporus]